MTNGRTNIHPKAVLSQNLEYEKFIHYYENGNSAEALIAHNKHRVLGGALSFWDLEMIRLILKCESNQFAKYTQNLTLLRPFNNTELTITQIYQAYIDQNYDLLSTRLSAFENTNVTQLFNIANTARFEYYQKQYLHSCRSTFARGATHEPEPNQIECSTQEIFLSSVFDFGRIGHALNDYVLLTLIAEKYGYKLIIGRWCLQYILQIENLNITRPVKKRRLDPAHYVDNFILNDSYLESGIDYFSPSISLRSLPEEGPVSRKSYIDYFQNRLKFRDWFHSHALSLLQLKLNSRQLVTVHVRKTDGLNRFESLSDKEIEDFLVANDFNNSKYMIYLCSDDVGAVTTNWARIRPNTSHSVYGTELPGWSYDLFTMSMSNIMFTSQSSFSHVGLFLNRTRPLVYDQDVDLRTFKLINAKIIIPSEGVLK